MVSKGAMSEPINTDTSDVRVCECAMADKSFREQYLKLERQKALVSCALKLKTIHNNPYVSYETCVKQCAFTFQ